MKERVFTGILLAIFMGVCLFVQAINASIGPYIFDVVIMLISILAVIEMEGLLHKSGKPVYKYSSIVVAIILCLIAIVGNLLNATALMIFISSAFVVILATAILFVFNAWFFKEELLNDNFRQVTNMSPSGFNFYKTNNSFISFFYPVFILSFFYYINHIDTLGFANITKNFEGVKIALFGLLLVFVIACFTDTFAMLFGRWIKGKKLCPKISPNKTISGALFGLLGGIIGAVVLYLIFNAIYAEAFKIVAWWQFMLIGFFGAAVAEAGDLLESYIKRKADVKDAGTFLKSHGGVLDRLDSIILCVPYVFMCMMFLFG